MENKQTSVLIAGAGPVGLSLALGLARYGVRSIIVEQKPTLSMHSKAALVNTRTLEVFHAYGIEDAFKAAGYVTQDVAIRDISGQPILHFKFSSLQDISPTPAVCIIPQSETERLLFEAVVSAGMTEVRFGHKLDSFKVTDSGVTAQILAEDGSYEIRANYLCGCDGPQSTVRSVLGMELEGKTYDAHAVLADVELPADRPEDDRIRIDTSRRGLNLMLRFTPTLWRLIVAVPGSAQTEAPSKDFIIQEVQRYFPSATPPITWSSAFKIHCRNARAFRSGKVLLLGDAAHLNSPAGGQGMNAGIHDAFNLAWKLQLVLAGGDEEVLLSSFDSERQDAVKNGVDVTTDRLTKIGVTAHPLLRRMVIGGVNIMSNFDSFAIGMAETVGMLKFRHRPSAAIHASGGMRAAKKYFAPQGAMHDENGTFVVVRPDNIVAYRGQDRAEAERYLAIMRVPRSAGIGEKSTRDLASSPMNG